MSKAGASMRGARMATAVLLAELLIGLGLGRLALRVYRLAFGDPANQAGVRVLFLSQLASLEERTGRLAEAMMHIEEAIGIEPENPGLCFERGLMWENRGEAGPALADFERSLRLGTDFGAEFRAALQEKIDQLKGAGYSTSTPKSPA
jgi:tetratricopeptide (TPR) repeat protein